MRRTTDELIATLAQDARPVGRLRPPMLRAAIWLGLLLLAAGAAVAAFSDVGGAVARAAVNNQAVALTGALLTGLAGVIAAAHLSLPDRSRQWALLPLPPLALWLLASGVGCIGLPAQHELGDSGDCFVFLLGVSLPVSALLFWRLRRAHPLDPGLVGISAALGVSGLAATALHFFHPFPVTWLDLGVHLAAVAAVVAVGGAVSAPALASKSGRTR